MQEKVLVMHILLHERGRERERGREEDYRISSE
jgi:hypothetical protein